MTPTSLVPEIAACRAFVCELLSDGGGRFVFALRSGQNRRMNGAAPRVFGLSLTAEHFVLPRPLCRFACCRAGRGEFTSALCCVDVDGVFPSRKLALRRLSRRSFPHLSRVWTARSGFAVTRSRSRETAKPPKSIFSTSSN